MEVYLFLGFLVSSVRSRFQTLTLQNEQLKIYFFFDKDLLPKTKIQI